MRRGSQDSTLTFAVVFDPEKGLETFSGKDLCTLASGGASASQKDIHRAPSILTLKTKPSFNLAVPTTKRKREPFAIFSSRQPYFIDVRSARTYDKVITNSKFDLEAATPSNVSTAALTCSDMTSTFGIGRKSTNSIPFPSSESKLQLPPPSGGNATKPAATPHSVFTFAALWDPEGGISLYKHGVPVLSPDGYLKNLKSTGTSRSTSPTPPPSSLSPAHHLPRRPSRNMLRHLYPGGYLDVEPPSRTASPFSAPASTPPHDASSFSSRILFDRPTRVPQCTRGTIPSSTLEGLETRMYLGEDDEGGSRPWTPSYSCFDPLDYDTLGFDPQQAFAWFEEGNSSGSEYDEYEGKDDADDSACHMWTGNSDMTLRMRERARLDAVDEGFFEMSSHFDCEPHLPSRFSTTTTSTNTYIAVDSRSVPPAGVVQQQQAQTVNPPPRPSRIRALSSRKRSGSSPSTPTPTSSRGGNTSNTATPVIPPLPPNAKSIAANLPPPVPRERKLSKVESVVRISSRVFRNRWSKRPQDERWVLVEVKPVVTERVLNEFDE